MFRFTIRDLLWLMVVVAVSCGWWLEARRSPSRQTEFRASAMERALKNNGYRVEQPNPRRVIITGQGTAHFSDDLGRSESPKE